MRNPLLLFLFYMLLSLITVAGNAQEPRPSLDSSMFRLSTSKPDTARIRIYLNIAQAYFNKIRLVNRMDSVAFYLQKAEQLNKNFNIATFQNRINYYYALRRINMFPSEDHLLTVQPLIDACKKTGDKETGAMAWMILGVFMESDSTS